MASPMRQIFPVTGDLVLAVQGAPRFDSASVGGSGPGMAGCGRFHGAIVFKEPIPCEGAATPLRRPASTAHRSFFAPPGSLS